MGYFSDLAAQYRPHLRDHSYTAPETQLLWRLEELEDRLRELTTQKTGTWDLGACFSADDLRYVLPKHFLSVSDVRKAIELAVDDRAKRYGISVRQQPAPNGTGDAQVSFADILSLQACPTAVAA